MTPVALTSVLHRGSVGKEELVDGVRHIRSGRGWLFGASKLGRIVRYAFSGIHLLWQMRKTIRRENPDIVHFHSFYSVWPLHIRLARRWSKAPVVYEVRGLLHETGVSERRFKRGSLRYRILLLNIRRCAIAADIVVAISRPLAEHIKLWGVPDHKTRVVPNGVDYQLFAEERNRLPPLQITRELGKHFVIGYIGSIRKLEGLDVLLDALQRLDREDVKALIVGDGPYFHQFSRTVKESAVAHRVLLTGGVPHDQVTRYYHLIDLFCLCRRAEGATELVPPLKPLEAMACGVPVTASDTPALRETLDNGRSGLLYPAGDSAALARVIIYAMRHPEELEEVKCRAERFVRTERDWHVLVKRYARIYTSLTGCS